MPLRALAFDPRRGACDAAGAPFGERMRAASRLRWVSLARTTARIRAAVVAPFALAIAACSAAPGSGEDSASSSAAITGSTIVSRGMEWVNAELHYCQAAHDAVDYDSSCWAFEGSSHRCDRQSGAAWNAYRSDCSGFVTFAWGLPAVGDGGYVTSEFAPYGTSFSHTIDGVQLQPGDALNKTPDEHIVLFKQWVSTGHTAIFMEEPGCSSATPYAHEFTSNVSISGSEVYISYEGATFYAIRFNGTTASGGGGGSSSGGGGSGERRRLGGGPRAARATASAPRHCSATRGTGSSGRTMLRRARRCRTSPSRAASRAGTARRRCSATAGTGCRGRAIRRRARRGQGRTEGRPVRDLSPARGRSDRGWCHPRAVRWH